MGKLTQVSDSGPSWPSCYSLLLWSLFQSVFKCVFCQVVNPLPHMPILSSPNSAANKNMVSKIRTNAVQLSDRVENIVGKEEIAHYEQFLLFPQC